jgi:hypothetical protein
MAKLKQQFEISITGKAVVANTFFPILLTFTSSYMICSIDVPEKNRCDGRTGFKEETDR